MPGDIVAIAGLKETTTGDTLCDPLKPVILERMEFPEPVIEIAIEPKTKADQEKMGLALNRLAAEDPSFRVKTDEESGQTIIAGMGELHLDILVDRMKREFKVEANIGSPAGGLSRDDHQARPRSTTPTRSRPAVRASSPASRSCIEPNEAGGGYEFESKIVGGNVPKEYIPGVEKGINSVMTSGIDRRLPGRRRQGDADRRRLSRRRLQRAGLRDRLPRGLPRGTAEGRVRSCSSRS